MNHVAVFSTLLAVTGLCATSAHAECDSVAGGWQLDNEIEMADCGEPNSRQEIYLEIEQTGCAVKLAIHQGPTLSGTVSGNVIHIEDSYEEEGTIYKDLELTVDGSRMNGGGEWLWDSGDDELSCGGTETFDGKRA